MKAGSIVILTEDGAKEVMRRWDDAHPFHILANFVHDHPDARMLIKNGDYDKYCEVTLAPATFEKYRKQVEKMSCLHLSNWEGPWFKLESQMQLPKPKYHVRQEAIVKDYVSQKYVRAKITKIVAQWDYGFVHIGNVWKNKPCVFESWAYDFAFSDHHFQYPVAEDEVTPTIAGTHEKEQQGQEDWKKIFAVTTNANN